ncbi:MRG/MORF4L-binding protein-like [Dysidea avara]|uniref:MRG/MORF4L-binding protein-like n=1 Tax=Dysidea avara TaxID=196820 RepID=UPI00333301D8
MPGDQEIVWTPELEVALFHSMHGHKPVGLNKHFNMICIQFRLSRATGRQITTQQIWDHLKTMYDIETLDENECLPFPNDEKEFTLPDDFMKSKLDVISPKQPLSPKEGSSGTPKENVRKRLRVSSNGSSPSSPTVHTSKRRRQQ